MNSGTKCCCCCAPAIDELCDHGENDNLLYAIHKAFHECGDEYAAYVMATMGVDTAEGLDSWFGKSGNFDEADDFDEDEDIWVSYVRVMKPLAEKNNPWALGALGRHYTFDEPSPEGYNYLLLGSSFGDAPSQFHFGFNVRNDVNLGGLSKRLINASAQRGHARAVEFLEAENSQ
ncbi:MAG: hypothetical protein ABJM43_21495 [Paracoccaceae bacterium]